MAWREDDLRAGRLARFAAGALISLSAFAFACAPAQAHRYRHIHHYAHSGRHAHYAVHAHYWRHAHYGRRAHYAVAAIPRSPAFSAIVVDANSGRTLYAVDENGLRHPASLTKVMTLYLLFEQLDKGAMTLQTRIPISEHAAAQEPTKLGIPPGGTISVDDAIKAIVTRSANDIAVAIAEAIGHDESAFAEMMTHKARALGMSSTVYRNASGLPNDEQVTSARDLVILARALEERFPRYFHYFSTREFDYAGEAIGNHNHLLGHVAGVDGIKTGYTRASGFNLLTSVHRDGRSLIAVVMGGRTSRARDRVMENLIADHIAQASTVRTATMVADASRAEDVQPAATREEQPVRPRPILVAANVPMHVPTGRFTQPRLAEGDAADDGSPTLRVAAVTPVEPRRPARRAVLASTPPRDQRTPAQLGWVKGPDAAAPKGHEADVAREGAEAPPMPPVKPWLSEASARTRDKAIPGRPAAASETTIAARAPSRADDQEAGADRGGWVIQIGALDDPAKANALLNRARERSRAVLGSAKPYTEKIQKGEDTFYRARFAGLDSNSAASACRSLKRSGFSCFAAHD